MTEKKDYAAWLRKYADEDYFGPKNEDMLREAADEIDRLREALRHYGQEDKP